MLFASPSHLASIVTKGYTNSAVNSLRTLGFIHRVVTTR
uniref:Uncharacterized protein n=1 Tax=Rhizophora mucronata TaxID=61149 RepID=A0A2P2M9I1_RHIMU